MESLLNEIQLSEKIHVSLACLRRWRLRGEGPQYVKVGPLVRYRPEVVEQWVDGLIFTSAVDFTCFSERLKAVLRMRVVKTNSFAKGGLAMENVRVFPSASVSSGSVRVTSANWPALKLNPAGFSK